MSRTNKEISESEPQGVQNSSKKRTQKVAVENEDQPTSKKVRTIGLSKIKSSEEFMAQFGDKISISPHPWELGSREVLWTAENTIQLAEFIAQRLVASYHVLNFENENSLYPIVFDILCSFISISRAELTIMSKTVAEIKEQQSRELLDDVSDNEEDIADKEVKNVNKAESIEELKNNFVVTLEQYLKSEKLTGFVEFIISRSRRKTIHAVVVVKMSILNAQDVFREGGFWQLCAEMATAQASELYEDGPTYGVFTDGFTWCFCCLENNRIRASHAVTYISKGHSLTCTSQIGTLFDYLFLLMGLQDKGNVSQYLQQNGVDMNEKINLFVEPLRYITQAREIGRAEGKAEGRAEGKAEGRAEGLELVARNAIKAFIRGNFSLEFAKTALPNLTSEEIEAIWTEEAKR